MYQLHRTRLMGNFSRTCRYKTLLQHFFATLVCTTFLSNTLSLDISTTLFPNTRVQRFSTKSFSKAYQNATVFNQKTSTTTNTTKHHRNSKNASSPLDSITHEIKIYCAQECTEEQWHGHPLRVPPTAASQHFKQHRKQKYHLKQHRNIEAKQMPKAQQRHPKNLPKIIPKCGTCRHWHIQTARKSTCGMHFTIEKQHKT